MTLREQLSEEYDELCFMDGYDREKAHKKLMSFGMTDDEAVEFFEFNQIGAWAGDLTPCFLEVRK